MVSYLIKIQISSSTEQLSFQTLKIRQYSIIHPYLKYGIDSWHGHLSRPAGEFMCLRKKAIKAEFNLNFVSHINDCFELKLTLKHKDLYKLNLGCYLYKILHNKNNDCFAQQFRSYSELHNHNTENNSSLIIPRINVNT